MVSPAKPGLAYKTQRLGAVFLAEYLAHQGHLLLVAHALKRLLELAEYLVHLQQVALESVICTLRSLSTCAASERSDAVDSLFISARIVVPASAPCTPRLAQHAHHGQQLDRAALEHLAHVARAGHSVEYLLLVHGRGRGGLVHLVGPIVYVIWPTPSIDTVWLMYSATESMLRPDACAVFSTVGSSASVCAVSLPAWPIESMACAASDAE